MDFDYNFLYTFFPEHLSFRKTLFSGCSYSVMFFPLKTFKNKLFLFVNCLLQDIHYIHCKKIGAKPLIRSFFAYPLFLANFFSSPPIMSNFRQSIPFKKVVFTLYTFISIDIFYYIYLYICNYFVDMIVRIFVSNAYQCICSIHIQNHA